MDAVVVNAKKLALFPSLLQAGEPGSAWLGYVAGRSVRTGLSLGFERIVLHGQSGCVQVRLLYRLLDQFVTAALAEPGLNPVSKCAVLPGGNNRDLAVAARLRIRLAHGGFVSRKLLLDPGAYVARSPREVVLGIVQFILVKCELCLSDFQIVRGCSWRLG